MLKNHFPVVPPRIRRMLLAVFFGRGLMAIRQLIMVPIMIRAWGTEYYGAWLILSAIPTFMAMSNMGIGTAARTRATLEFAAGHASLAKQTIRLGSLIVAAVGLVVVGIVYFCMHWLLHDDATVGIIERSNSVVAVLMATTFIQMLASPFDATWVGLGKAPFAQNASNVLNIVTILGMVGAILTRQRALMLGEICLFITVAWAAVYIFLSCRAAGNVSDSSPAPLQRLGGWRLAWDLTLRGVGFQAGALWQAILFQGSIVVAGSVLGANGAALWGAMRIIIRSGNQFLDLIGQTVAPEYQIAFARKDWAKLKKNYRASMHFGVFASVFMTAALLVFGRQVFNLWTRHSFDVPYLAWATLCLSLIPFSLWWNGAVLQDSVNKPWLLNLCGVFSATVTVGLMRLFGNGGITYFSAFALLFDVMMALLVFPLSFQLFRRGKAVASDGEPVINGAILPVQASPAGRFTPAPPRGNSDEMTAIQ